jgi:hypothetical protein
MNGETTYMVMKLIFNNRLVISVRLMTKTYNYAKWFRGS